jgi:hypothetical protein
VLICDFISFAVIVFTENSIVMAAKTAVIEFFIFICFFKERTFSLGCFY